MNDKPTARTDLLTTIRQKVESFMKESREKKELKRENEMMYWSGRLGRTFTAYPEMCGARDAHLEDIAREKARLAPKPQPVNTKTSMSSPWNLMGLKT